jgi:phospholipid/cholesterol/gamma-HCH transport system permease protein
VTQPPLSLFPQRPGQRDPNLVTRIGSKTVTVWSATHRLLETLFRALWSPFQPGESARAVCRRIAVRQVFFTGFEALPLVSVIASLLGATIVIQAQLLGTVSGDVLGRMLVAVVLREIAPLTTAIVVAGRSGTAIATELGNMKVNNEILALASLGIDPYRFIVLPRLVGTVVSVLVLTVYFCALAILGGFVANLALYNTSLAAMQSGFSEALVPLDLPLFFCKGLGLGVLVGWLCCHFGMEVGASPTEVPQRASQAVVYTLLGCVVFNTLVTVGFYSLVGPPLQ